MVGDPKCSDRELEMRVRDHLAEWFAPGQGATGVEEGPVGTVSTRQTDVVKWRHLRTYRVPYAQPAQTPPVEEGDFYARKAEVKHLGQNTKARSSIDCSSLNLNPLGASHVRLLSKLSCEREPHRHPVFWRPLTLYPAPPCSSFSVPN